MNNKKGMTRERGWLLAIIIVMLVAFWLLALLYGRVAQKDAEQNDMSTASDLYWFDQTVSNRISRDQQVVWGIAREVAHNQLNAQNFNARTEAMLESYPELTNVVWLSKTGAVRARAASIQSQLTAAPQAREALEQAAQDKAVEIHQTTSTPPVLMSDGTYEISFILPFYDAENDQLQGFMKSQYALKELFVQAVPDWFARKYHLHVYSGEETIYSTMHSDSVRFDESLASSERNINLATTSILMKAQLYPDGKTWVLRGLFGGVVLLLLGLVGSLLALVRDMRSRRETERELRVAYLLRSAIENSLTVGIRAHRTNGALFYVNPAFCSMIGYDEDELVDIPPPLPYIPESEVPKIMALMAQVAENPDAVNVMDVKMRRKSGEIIDTIMRGSSMHDDQGQLTGWITSVEDVTNQRRLEDYQAGEQKRIESVNHLIRMGEMASVIAHELNQPLSAISGYATGLSNHIKKDPNALSGDRLIEVTEKIRRQAERAANVTRRVQEFARSKTMLPETINPADLVMQTIELMELEFKKKACIVNNLLLHDELKLVKVDITMAQQILINLMRNALDAMVDHGSNPREITIKGQNYSEHHVLIEVIDKGPGIPESRVETIFKPFYTTKIHGVGIGLNICRTMIESNGGRLWAKSDEGGGIFYLTLPIVKTELE